MPAKKKKRPVGRPKADIDPVVVEKLAGMLCTSREIAAYFGVDHQTILNNFSPVLEKGRETGKMSLRRKQYATALSGNVSMMIWLGKNDLGQADRREIDSNVHLTGLKGLLDEIDGTDKGLT